VTALGHFNMAARGWYLITLGRPGGRELFVPTWQGLLVAIAGYFGAVLLGIVFQSLLIGVPNILELLAGLGINALPLIGFVAATLGTIAALRVQRHPLEMLVPGIHAITMLLIAGFLMSAVLPGLASLLLGLLLFMLFRAGREILGLNFALALAYAALTIVLLVALPTSLYMLMGPGPS
jgi:hypothetical protein